MKIANHICRVGIFPKKDDYFRLKGQVEGQIQYITGTQFTIGTSSEADVVLTAKGIGEYSLKVTVKERELWLEDMNSSQKTIVSGTAVKPREPFHYKSGEVVQIEKADLLMTFELFNRSVEPQLEGDILREAKDKAESLLSTAQRQLEEKNRLAIEESHAHAEAIHHQAKAEADAQSQKILERAQVTAGNLVASAKTEVDLLLKDAQAKATAMKSEMAKLTEEKARLLAEVSQCKNICDEAMERKRSFIQQALETENEYDKAKDHFEEFQSGVKKSEAEWANQLGQLKAHSSELEELAKNSQRAQKEAEAACSQLKNQYAQLEKQVNTLNSQQTELSAEIKKAEIEKTKCVAEINDLKNKYQSELKNLRQKIDEELQRQKKSHEIHFQNLREQENLDLQSRQAALEKAEAKRLELQITKTHERLWQMISDRAVLFGIADLHGNNEFKKDLRDLTGQALTEDFDLRRREVLATLPSSRSLMAKQRFSHGVARYAGWIISVCLLGVLLYAQFSPLIQQLERKPASSGIGDH